MDGRTDAEIETDDRRDRDGEVGFDPDPVPVPGTAAYRDIVLSISAHAQISFSLHLTEEEDKVRKVR